MQEKFHTWIVVPSNRQKEKYEKLLVLTWKSFSFLVHSRKIIKYSSFYIFSHQQQKKKLSWGKHIFRDVIKAEGMNPVHLFIVFDIISIYTNDNNPKMRYTMWIVNFPIFQENCQEINKGFFSFDVENCTPSCLSIFLFYWICCKQGFYSIPW